MPVRVGTAPGAQRGAAIAGRQRVRAQDQEGADAARAGRAEAPGRARPQAQTQQGGPDRVEISNAALRAQRGQEPAAPREAQGRRLPAPQAEQGGAAPARPAAAGAQENAGPTAANRGTAARQERVVQARQQEEDQANQATARSRQANRPNATPQGTRVDVLG